MEVSWYTLSVRKKQGKRWAETWRGKQMMQGIFLKRIKHSFKDILTVCVQLFGTPWTVVFQAPLFIGFSRQEYWSGLPFPPPGDFPNLGIEPKFLASLHWQADSLPLYHLGSLCINITRSHKLNYHVRKKRNDVIETKDLFIQLFKWDGHLSLI